MIPINRRQMMVATGFTLGIATSQANADEASVARLGFSLYGMKSLTLSSAIKACAEIGYRDIELALIPGYPAEPGQLSSDRRREIRRQLSDSRLSLASLMENLLEPAEGSFQRTNLDRLKVAAELGHALSPGAPPVIETTLGGTPEHWDRVKGRLVERLQTWARTGDATKTVIAIKPHVAHALHSVDGAAWLIRQVNSPWLRLAFDFSHFALRGIDIQTAIESLIPLSVFVHVKDARGTAEKFEFLLPGDGTIDYGAYFGLLRSAAFKGPIVVEVSGQISGKAGYDPIAAARHSFRKLTAALAKSR